MTYKQLFLMLIFVTGISAEAQQKDHRPIFPKTTMVNQIEYNNSKYSQDSIGNGFLLLENNKIYAVTAKHILLLAKTDSMQTVSFNGELKRWSMYPKNNSEQRVIIDRLFNESNNDSLNWGFVEKKWLNYPDWLVFSIKENRTDIKPLRRRTSPLQIGEKLYAIGWTYNDKDGEQRVYEYSYLRTKGTHFYMKGIVVPPKAGGLSGSPVVDTKGLLVGIISTADEDPVTKEVFTLACTTESLVGIMDSLQRSPFKKNRHR